MIPYTLAKEMKEAGYPQKGNGNRIQVDGDTEMVYDGSAYVPLLEEVIEALGENVSSIQKVMGTKRWYASTYGRFETCEGPTPLIAACNLWLVVNRK